MKLKRAKAYKKLMSYLQLNFNFREPYQVLVDEEIVIEARKCKIDLIAGFERTLHGKVKVMITQCTMEHLYRSKDNEAIEIAKKFERRRCGHLPKDDATLSSFECMHSVVDINGHNKHRYAVATQKPKLRQRLRQIPAVPIIYLNRSVMILEPMSPATERARNEIEEAKLKTGLNKLQPADSELTEKPSSIGSRSRKAQGANPLSVKKRKREATTPGAEDNGTGSSSKRRKRGKKKSESSAEVNEIQDDSVLELEQSVEVN